MTNSELDKLKELAERATPGPWESFYHNRTESWALTHSKKGCDGVNHLENVLLSAPDGRSIYSDTTDYIAAVSPDVVLKLIERIKYSEERRTHHSAVALTVLEITKKENESLCAQLDEAREVIEHVAANSGDYGVYADKNPSVNKKARAYLEKYK